MKRKLLVSVLLASGLAAFGSSVWVAAQQNQAGVVAIDPDDVGGRVVSSRGPEAGVWVIAETTDLPTKFTRIVVTDDQDSGPAIRPTPRGTSKEGEVKEVPECFRKR